MTRLPAYRIYLILETVLEFCFGMIFTASMVYQVQVVGLNALQLVLVGTAIEATIFIFEVPTGVVADVYSRRLSVIIGVVLIGLGSMLEGSVPIFFAILAAQVLWGVGYTFTSGATQAWITDEIGEDAAAAAFLRSNQLGLIGALSGLGVGIGLGINRVNLPIQVGGLLIVLLGIFLALFMPETGFKPAPRHELGQWAGLRQTFERGWAAVRSRPALMTLLGIGLIYGLYSEGFDRLWTKQLLDHLDLPIGLSVAPVVFIGGIRAVGMLISVGATELARRRLASGSYATLARLLWSVSGLLVLGLFGFALARSSLTAVAAYWLIAASRNMIDPLYTALVNRRLDSSIRATVLSMSGQMDAIGQIAGGPVLGAIGSLISVRAALLASAAILSPVLALFPRAIRLNDEQPVQIETAAGE